MAAWCFDRAVFMFGSEMEADLKAAGEGAKNKQQSAARQQRVFSKWLGTGKVRFKDPAATGGRNGEVNSTSAAGPVSL